MAEKFLYDKIVEEFGKRIFPNAIISDIQSDAS